jgi:hypothetical protein
MRSAYGRRARYTGPVRPTRTNSERYSDVVGFRRAGDLLRLDAPAARRMSYWSS